MIAAARRETMEKVLIIGATSRIAQETARRYARAGARLFLVARDPEKLSAVASDLRVLGATEVGTSVMDADDHERHAGMLARAREALGELDLALVAYGTLPDQAACERTPGLAAAAMRTNGVSTCHLLLVLAEAFEQQGRGRIAVITSVAGDRGRRSNYVYGASKALVSVFLEGLRARLRTVGVGVTDLKPGLVNTPMTAHLESGPLFSDPATVARGIQRAVERGRGVAYIPFYWRWIMLVVRMVPGRILARFEI